MTEHKEQQQHEPTPAQHATQPPLTPEQEHIVKLIRQHSLANALRLHGKAVPK